MLASRLRTRSLCHPTSPFTTLHAAVSRIAWIIVTAAICRPACGSDVAGNALLFDGTDDAALIPDSPSLHLATQAITVEFWLYQNSYSDPNSAEWLLTKASAGCGFAVADNSYATHNAFIDALFYFDPTMPPASVDWGPSPLFQWFHIAFAVDSSIPFARLFINGALVAETSQLKGGDPIPSLPVCSNTSPVRIGGLPPFPDNYVDGMIDEVRIWDVARTPAEIAANYNHLVAPDSPGLVGCWHFDEAVDDQHIYDSSPFANQGTLGASLALASDDPTRVASTAPIVSDCPADLNADGQVGINDFLILLAFWGPCTGVCLGDLDGDGAVGIVDFLQLLGTWGPCP